MAAGTGAASSVRVKAEATPGTRPASGFFSVPFSGFELIPKVAGRKVSKALGSSYAAVNAAFRSPLSDDGSISVEGGYNGGLDWLLYAMLGAKATSGGGADPYTNIYTPSATPPTFHHEVIEGNIPVGKCLRHQNVVVPELVISGDAGGNIDARATLVAEKEVSIPAGDTPTATGLVTPVEVPIQNQQGVAWNMGVGSDTLYCLRKWSLTMRRPLAPPRACMGSAFYKAPLFLSPLELNYQFEIEWEDIAMYRAFVDGTVLTAVKIKYTGPALLTGFYDFEARVNRSDLDEAGPPAIQDNGALVQILKGTGYGNAGAAAATEPITFTTKNLINGAVI